MSTTNYFRNIFFFSFILLMSSCATLFNSKKTRLTITTNVPSKMIVNNDTLAYTSTDKIITVERDKKPLLVTAFNDSLTKSVEIKSRLSGATWLNLYFGWLSCVGFIVDTKTKKGFAYPKKVYIDFSDTTEKYLKYIPLSNPYSTYNNILKITPLKLVGADNPGIEISCERRTGKHFSTQIMASYLLPRSAWGIGLDFKPNVKGFRVAIEEKYYLRNLANFGPYIGFEFNYLKNKYRQISRFGEADIYSDTAYNNINYADTFGIKKQTFSFNLKLGYQIIIKRLSFDIYSGFGIRYKDVHYFDRINPLDEMEYPRHLNVGEIKNREGKYWTPSIPLNIKVGWTF